MTASLNCLRKVSVPTLFCKIAVFIVDTLLLAVANIHFYSRYVPLTGMNMLESWNSFLSERSIFLIDFYVFISVFYVCIAVIVFSGKRQLQALAVLFSVLSANLCLYTVDEIFTIKIFIFSVWFFTVCTSFDIKVSLPLCVCTLVSFLVVLSRPIVMDDASEFASIVPPDSGETFSLLLVLIAVFLLSAAYRFAVYSWQESEDTKRHINAVMSQMTRINQELQDFAKNKGKEAADQERLRITRDMHDSCGYVFVNIVGLMEACESGKPMEWERVIETFETVRSLAANGLRETRKTLYAIRDIQSPVENSLDALVEIRNIFQKVTGITVVMDKGNMRSDYGRTINKILIRTMQEALTNAVRHGLATYVSVYFREDGDCLYMTVKDNGIGSKKVVKGIGLAGMEERLSAVGGKLSAGDSAEGGFKLEIMIPAMSLLMEEYGKQKTEASAG